MSSSDEAKGDLRSHDDEVTEKCVLNLLARMMHADADLMLFLVLCVCLAPAACFSENFSALEVVEGLRQSHDGRRPHRRPHRHTSGGSRWFAVCREYSMLMVPPSLAQRLGAEPEPEPQPTTAAVAGMWTEDEKCTLHVRMIVVGGCKSETSLRQVFSPYGSLVFATVRLLPCLAHRHITHD